MMNAFLSRISLCAVMAATLAGCGSGTMSANPWYEAPAGVTAATGATVAKSDNSAGGTVPDGDTRVVTVDGQTVSPMDFDKVVLAPGAHSLGVKYNGTAAIATVTMGVMARPGESYEVKGERTGPCDAELWLQGVGANAAPGSKLETHLTAKPSAYGASAFAVACN
jgi:hypothetical protein